MRYFKFFWDTHKWTGIIAAVFLLTISVTGFVLLLKKEFDILQPSTQVSTVEEFELHDFKPIHEVLANVFAQNHPHFVTLADIERIDLRPKQRTYKVRSKHDNQEFQVDALTGEVRGESKPRWADWLETIHDGSILHDGVKVWFMPLVALSLIFLIGSGLYLWLAPLLKKRSRLRKKKA